MATPGYHDDKAAVLARLKRVEGQIRGLQRMVDEDTYCIDVLTQVSARIEASLNETSRRKTSPCGAAGRRRARRRGGDGARDGSF